jgi:hypothetical protein
MGWATTIPALQKVGLRLKEGVWGNSSPVYRGRDRLEAAQSLFGISERTAEYLFGGDHFAHTPKGVAKLIDKVIARKGEVPSYDDSWSD